MLMIEDAPNTQSVEVDTEEMRRRNDAFNRLLSAKVAVSHVYRTWIGPDSDVTMTVAGSRQVPVETVLFLDTGREPHTALFAGDGTVQIKPGW